jgi:DNA-binding GntR family transcriptional regulator
MSSNSSLPNFSPLAATRTQAVAAELRRTIQSGDIPAGTRLRQVDIAKRLGVSTTPVREAFALLEREGLITHTTHRGAIVFRPKVEDLRENYEMRIALESLAARIATTQISATQVAELKVLLDEMRGVREPVTYAQFNRRFHMLIYVAADRPQLSALIQRLRDAAAAYIQIMAARQVDSSQTHAEHEAIFATVAGGEPQRAAEATAEHLQHNFEFILVGLT